MYHVFSHFHRFLSSSHFSHTKKSSPPPNQNCVHKATLKKQFISNLSLSLSRHHINFIFYYNALCIRTRELLDAYFEKSYNNQTLSLSFKVCLVKDSLKLIIDKLIKDTSLKVKKDPYCDRRNIFVKCWCVK